MRLPKYYQERIENNPNINIYTEAIFYCGKKNRYGDALVLFEEMKKKGINPDRLSYSAVITACIKASDKSGPDLAISFYKDMTINNNITPDNIICCKVMKAFILKNRLDLALKFFYDLESININYDISNIKTVMFGLEKDNKWNQIYKINKWNEIYKIYEYICDKELELDLDILNIVILANVKLSNYEKAINIYNKYLKINKAIANNLLNACEKINNMEKANELIEIIKSERLINKKTKLKKKNKKEITISLNNFDLFGVKLFFDNYFSQNENDLNDHIVIIDKKNKLKFHEYLNEKYPNFVKKLEIEKENRNVKFKFNKKW